MHSSTLVGATVAIAEVLVVAVAQPQLMTPAEDVVVGEGPGHVAVLWVGEELRGGVVAELSADYVSLKLIWFGS